MQKRLSRGAAFHKKTSVPPDNDAHDSTKNSIHAWYGALIISFTICLAVALPKELSHSVSVGLSLCASVIIPSVFPYMVISDLISNTVDFRQFRLLSFTFSYAFNQKCESLSAFILGILCGFPLGAKRACELYKSGIITKGEAERLIGFTNNPGIAFIVSGIGVGLIGDVWLGALLYLSCVLSAIFVGVLFSIGSGRDRHSSSPYESHVRRCTFSLTDSIRTAGTSTVTVCSFIVFFSSVCGLIRSLSLPSYVYLFAVSLLEVGSATSIICKASYLPDIIRLSFLAFAVGSSGLSVHLQAGAYLRGTDIKMHYYFPMKLLQGVVCTFIFRVLIFLMY